MKKNLFILFFLFPAFSYGQTFSVDSLRQALLQSKEDTTKIKLFQILAGQYTPSKPDSSLFFYRQGLALAKQGRLFRWEAIMYRDIGRALGQIPEKKDSALLYIHEAIALARQNSFVDVESACYNALGNLYRFNWEKPDSALISFFAAVRMLGTANLPWTLGDALKNIGEIYYNLAEYKSSLFYYTVLLELDKKWQNPYVYITYSRLGAVYGKLRMPDSAIFFAEKCYVQAERVNQGHIEGMLLDDIAEIYAEVGQDSIAMYYFRKSLPEIQPNTQYYELNRAEIYIGLAKLFRNAGQVDSSFFYARLAFPYAQNTLPLGTKETLLGYIYDASKIISAFYKSKRQADSALFYQDIAFAAKDSLTNQEKIRTARNIEFSEQLRQEQANETEAKYRSRINSYFFGGGLLIVLLIAVFLYRNNRLKRKANLILQGQKQKVEMALDQLKSAQAQLIQSEKMASLGELTAGIAHEIQNPLNFVNNFSEVSAELVDEWQSELAKGNGHEATEIAKDVKQNLDKIIYHGKRADAIVKSMLQHSRTSSRQKELTDINAVADEYLRLAYHGMRAKDKSFNAKFETNFDRSIDKINLVPQDIGRALLNLMNNAFYAVGEKQMFNPNGYAPVVTVTTKKLDGKVEIRVNDNGNGIPQAAVNKIFQPFFTTKPTGQGTGLGLSLAYDIIKAQGGEIRVVTKENEGSEFIIQLPSA